MKKAIALILSSAMLVTGVAGLATACSKKGPAGDQPAKNFKRLVDPRDAEGFEVHEGKEGYEVGKLIGKYPSIADAINAAVYNDLDEFEVEDVPGGTRGSYVTKKGSTRKIFENMTSYAGGTGDNFWYYNNNGLAGFEYYPMAGAPYNRAQNTTDIVYSVTEGTKTNAEVSSYGVIDGLGQPLDVGTFNLSGRAWELTPVSDASIKGIPVREAGATGARYELDLTDVKIKPAYQGVKDDIYAFFGYTIGAGNYSIDIGVACNVNTGIWRQYISHNPYNNHYNNVVTEYNVGKVLFTSTWNEAGGYYAPDVDTVVLEVLEVKDEDENADDWWYDLVTITADDEELLKVVVDDAYIVKYGGGSAFDVQNGFYFVAGLDVVASGAKLGDSNKAMDYTNGATFENLVVTKGEIYFHSDEEFDEGDYGAAMSPDATPGEWHNIHTPYKGIDKGIYNYTILQLNACVEYEMDGNTDVYSFRYDKYEAESEFAGLLKTYQDQIDELYEITEDTAGEYKDKIAAVEELYKNGVMASSDVPEYCYLVLDWAALTYAKDIYKSAIVLSEAGEALYAEFEKLTNINVLDENWKGWSTTAEGDDAYGYLYNELELFRVMYDKLTNLKGGLTADDQVAFARLVGDKWNTWTNFMNGYDALQEASFADTEFSLPNATLTGTLTVLGKNLFEEYYKLVVQAYASNDAGKPACADGPGGTLCGENEAHFYLSFRVLYIEWVLEKQLKNAGVKLDYEAELMDMLRDYQTGGDLYLDFRYLAEVLTQINRIIKGECTYLDDELVAVINTYMVGNTYIKSSGSNNSNFNKGTWAYFYGNGTGGDVKVWNQYKGFFGLDSTNANRKLRDLLQEELYDKILKDNTDATFINVHYQGNDKGMIGLKLNKAVSAPSNLGTDAAEWLKDWQATTLTDLTDLSAWKGWKATGSDKEGYLADELSIFGGLYTRYQALSTGDKVVLAKDIDEEVWEAWSNFYTGYTKAITGSFKDENITVAGESYTGVQIIEELFKAVYSISGSTFGIGADFTASFRTLYLNEILKANFIEISYVDEVIDMLSAGDGAKVAADFDYLYHVLGQVAKVQSGALTKLDYDLAMVVNEHMYQVTGLASQVATENILTVAKDYFNINTDGVSGLKELVALLGDLIKQGKVQLNESGLGVDAKIADEDIPNQDSFTRQQVINAYDQADLSELDVLSYWYGWKSATADSQTYVKGYLYDELMKFEAVYAMYDKLGAADQQQVREHAGTETWTKWAEFSTQYKALADTNTTISVWSKDFSSQSDMTLAEVFGKFVDGAFAGKTVSCPEGAAHAVQGYLCVESAVCGRNTYYVLYLNKVLQGEDRANGEAVTLNQWTTIWNMIKDAGSGIALDFDYVWYMAKQVGRILDGNCKYLDAELAAAVNKYMHPDPIPQYNCFRNGSWLYYYRSSGWRGLIKNDYAGGGVPFLKAVHSGVNTLTENSYNWANAQAKINEILTDASYGGNLINVTIASSTANDVHVLPLFINCEVEAQKDPDDKTDEDRMAEIVRSFNALSDLTDLTPNYWLGGWKDGKTYHYVVDEILMFESLQTAAKAIKKEDEIKQEVGADKYDEWVSALTEYKALDADQTTYTIVNYNAETQTVGGEVTVPGTALVKGFFNALFQTYDKSVSNGSALNAYLCMEHKEHFLLSMRALYLRKLMQEKNVTFSLVDDMLETAEKLPSSGTLKYTGLSSTEGARMDFDYLWTMAKEIKRIKDGNIQELDGDLRKAIDSLSWYMRTSTASGYADKYGITNSFYNLSLCARYRDGGKIGTKTGDWDAGTSWLNYLGLDGTQTWNELLAEYINPLLSGEYDLIKPGNNNDSQSAAIFYVKK